MAASSYIAVTTYACTLFGYLEKYADPGVLVGATGGWTKVEAQS
jgi:hypothetical protein